jgi:glycosyltransferase involved in cell wall biosynthesis/spore maturation protein CgeB
VRRLLFLYKYSVFGGVASVLKQRMPILKQEDWSVQCVFEVDGGGSGGYLKAGVTDIYFLTAANDFSLIELLLKKNLFSCVNIFDWPEAVSAIRKIDLIIPIIYEVHTPIEMSLKKNTLETFKSSNITLVPSQWSIKFIKNNFPSVDLDRIAVVPNIVDETLFYPLGNLANIEREYKKNQIVWIGKFNDYKNWQEAWFISRNILKKIEEIELVWITGGDVPIENIDLFWTGFSKDETIERISWLHNLDHSKIGDILRKASFSGGMLLSSSKRESFCLVVHEAMRCGLPVLSTNVGALPEIIKDGVTGFLYEIGNVEQACEKIIQLYEDKELKDRITTAAGQFIQKFERPVIENRFKNILRHITGGFPAFRSAGRIELRKIIPHIAAIMDEFTAACFEPEAVIEHITPENWKYILDKTDIDFLFIESAWRGYKNKFQDVMDHPEKKEIIIDIINYSKAKGLPTLFWNKEDPTNFERFIDIAKNCDYIFTTDEGCIPRYMEYCCHKNIFLLPFAMQPTIHNPIDKNELDGFDIVFAGTWYHRFPERNKQLTELIEAAKKYHLFLYERTSADRYNKTYKNLYEWPQSYQCYLKSALPYHELLRAYRHFKVALNVSTVTDSPTMCARRLFELLGCAIPILSNCAIANDNMLPGLVNTVSNREEASKCLDSLMADPWTRAKQGHEGWRYVMEHHTYQHRMKLVCDTLGMTGLAEYPQKPTVLIISLHQDEEIAYEIKNMKWPKKRIAWISEDEIKDTHRLEHLLISSNEEYVVLFFETKCHFGQMMLHDLLTAFRYAQADILVKSIDKNLEKSWKFITTGTFKIAALKNKISLSVLPSISCDGLNISKLNNYKVFSVDPFEVIRSNPIQQLKKDNFADHILEQDISLSQKCDVLIQVDNFLIGGLENVVMDLAEILAKDGFSVILLVLGIAGESVSIAKERGIQVQIIRFTPEIYVRLLEKITPKIVISHYSLQGASICSRLRIPLIQVIHNAYIWFSDQHISEFNQAIKYTTLFVAVSDYVKTFSIDRLKVPENKCIVINNGIDFGRFDKMNKLRERKELREKYDISKDDFVLMSVGTINNQKNHIGAIRAFHLALKQVPNCKLVILGPANKKLLLDEIENFISKNDLDRKVIYAGATSNPYAYYAMADLFISASFFEGCQLTLLEAIKANLPIITTNVGIANFFNVNQGIYLVDPHFDIKSFRGRVWEMESSPLCEAQIAHKIELAYKNRSLPDISTHVMSQFNKENSYYNYEKILNEIIPILNH